MVAMMAIVDIVVAVPYLSQHYNLLASIGNLFDNLPTTITSGKLSGDLLYHIIATIRLSMAVLLWLLAFLCGPPRPRPGEAGPHPHSPALACFPLLAHPPLR